MPHRPAPTPNPPLSTRFRALPGVPPAAALAAAQGPPARAPLPTDPTTLPPLPPAFAAALDPALETLGIALAAGVRRALEDHVRLLLAWNAAINLTALRTPAAIALEHLADSLAALGLIRRLTVATGGAPDLLDLGSGGGYPGLPLAAALPAGRVALVESVAKKARFLAAAGAAVAAALAAAGLPAPAIAALPERAESLAREPAHREAWDLVTARAVAPLAELAELALPLLRVGGHLVAWKRAGGGLGGELAAARTVAARLGGGPARVHAVALPALADHRLVVIAKLAPTPARFPRRPAERRRPLLP